MSTKSSIMTVCISVLDNTVEIVIWYKKLTFLLSMIMSHGFFFYDRSKGCIMKKRNRGKSGSAFMHRNVHVEFARILALVTVFNALKYFFFFFNNNQLRQIYSVSLTYPPDCVNVHVVNIFNAT